MFKLIGLYYKESLFYVKVVFLFQAVKSDIILQRDLIK